MFGFDKKHVLLFCIIALIVFTFYCIIRLHYLKQKFYDISVIPRTTNYNVISYINNIQSKDKITDMPGCSGVIDDNDSVKTIIDAKYNDCKSAYSDYLKNNKDINNKYGKNKSLIEICPVTCNSNVYVTCEQLLLNKFTDNANILDGVTSDINTSINTRLNDRYKLMSDVQISMDPFLYSKDQNDFNINMFVNDQVAKYPSEVLGLVNNYYQDRYHSGNIESFTGSISVSTYIVDPVLEKTFLGTYKAIKGQFLALDDLTITIGNDTISPQTTKKTNKINNSNPNFLLTVSNSNNLTLTYNIDKLDNYKSMKSAIQIVLSNMKIISQPKNIDNVQQLLSILGVTSPTSLILVNDQFTSSEGVLHKNFKLLNDNLDTILVLQKV
jgi:hypothetical protein